jgi:hypothetical protein
LTEELEEAELIIKYPLFLYHLRLLKAINLSILYIGLPHVFFSRISEVPKKKPPGFCGRLK